MSLAAVDTTAGARGPGDGRRGTPVAVVVTAGVKAFLAAAAGVLLTCSLGIVIWAVTPSSGAGPVGLLRAAVAAFGAANGMTVRIGPTTLSLSPLILTMVAVALLTTVSGRGRSVASGPVQELAALTAATVAYAAAVTWAGVVLGPVGAIAADRWC